MSFLCEGITKEYNDFRLEDVHFHLPVGYVLGVIGRNGSGKSTLLNALLGLFPKMCGDAKLNGISLRSNPKEYKSQVSYILNQTPFSMFRTAKQIGLDYGDYYPGFSMETYLKMLDRFRVPRNRWLSSLSAGQIIRQQVAFAFSYNAKVFILDEPAGNLDVEFRAELYDMIRKIMEDGERTVICSSHLMEELEEISDYILYLKREENVSRVHYFGTTEELRERYRLISCDGNTMEHLLNSSEIKEFIVGGRKRESHSELMVLSEGLAQISAVLSNDETAEIRYADVKEIMYYLEKGKVIV